MTDFGLLTPTRLPGPVAVQQLRDSNTALTALGINGDITDAGAGGVLLRRPGTARAARSGRL